MSYEQNSVMCQTITATAVAERVMIINKTKVKITSLFDSENTLTEKLFVIADRKLKNEK